MNKPLLGPCDPYQLEPFEYPWAWDMSRECENNTWTPEEIQSASDTADYRGTELVPAHRHLFEAIMAQLTTFDLQRSEESILYLVFLIQPEEVRQMLIRMSWEERLHSRSYRYIIETLGMDLEIYSRWKTVPAMKARVDFANRISDELRAVFFYQARKADPHEFDLVSKQVILYSLIFWFHIFEGIWFMLNLKGPLQNISRLGHFRGAAEQLQYIARDEEQHVRFGMRLTETFLEQYPETWTKAFQEKIISLFHTSIQLEKDYAEYFLSGGPIIGYSVPDHVATAKFFANAKARSLDLPPPFMDARHCFLWMSESTELNKEKNFFEQRPTEYRTGGSLDNTWGDSVDAPDDDWNAPLSHFVRKETNE